MTILLFIVIPSLWGLAGYLLGPAVAAAHFYSEAGWRRGLAVRRVAAPALLLGSLALVVAGVRGTAGTGITVFGSESLPGLLLAGALYAPPALALFAGPLYVVRDLTLGHPVLSEKGKS
jgi:hypothetical protein